MRNYIKPQQIMDPLYLLQILLENQVIPFCGSSVYITYYTWLKELTLPIFCPQILARSISS